MDTFQSLGTPNRSRFGVFKLAKPKRLRARHGLPDKINPGTFVYRAISELGSDEAWGTWLGEQRSSTGELRPVLLKHTGDNNRTRAGADALWLEALLSHMLEGQQVLPLLDYGVLDGRPFAVYDFEEGVFLAQVIEGARDRGVKIPSVVAVGIVLQACEAVGRLHDLRLDEGEAVGGFVHGSLCPRNFVLSSRGDVRVMGLIGARPVGRVVGREHVPEAALPYASPDLLGGAPVTPAVDVHSLNAVLSELLGPDEPAAEDELGRLLHEIVRTPTAGGYSTVRAYAGALHEAVRRTGEVVARQGISALVREICEKYLLERRKQVRTLLDTPWPDIEGEAPVSPGAEAAREVRTQAAHSASREPVAAPEPQVGAAIQPELAAYSEEVSDDAVTRFMDADGDRSAIDSGAQAAAWMHDSAPPEAGRASVSRWAVGALMGVLIAIALVAGLMADRSEPVAVAVDAEAPVVASASKAAEPPSAEADKATDDGALTQRAALTEQEGASAEQRRGEEEGAEQAADEPLEEQADAQGSEEAEEEAEEPPSVKRAAASRYSAGAKRRVQRARPRSAPARKAAPAKASAAEVEEPTADEPEVIELPAPKKAVVRERAARAVQAADDDLEIEEVPKMAYLSVDATPYADIFIDGKKRGVTPIVRLELSPGMHRLVARNAEGDTKRFTLALQAGKTEVLKVSWE